MVSFVCGSPLPPRLLTRICFFGLALPYHAIPELLFIRPCIFMYIAIAVPTVAIFKSLAEYGGRNLVGKKNERSPGIFWIVN